MMQKYKLLVLTTVTATILGACHTMPEQYETAHSTDSKHWEYSGATGPSHWGDIAQEFSTCKTGKLQSPFNITADITASLPYLSLNYRAVPMNIINNGHTIQADQTGGGKLVVDGKSYTLLQFHFHSGSEYSINGKSYPLEAHLVHAADDGTLAVVGVMFEEGAANRELANIWENMPSSKGENSVSGKTITVNNLLPTSKKYYRFMGSLTTPPCSEGVNWHMLTTPMTASKAQISAFKDIYPMNARPLQDENNRLVVLGK